MHQQTSYTIVSMNVGKPKTITSGGKDVVTGIYKEPVDRPLFLSKTNLDGDGQADLVHHGGEDKAVCVYPYDHYSYWVKELNRPLTYGAFGENLTVDGLVEEVVCIGDIYQIGEAVVQVSQPRQPCFKLAKRYNVVDLPVKFQNTGYTGYYFRVLREGLVTPESKLELVERNAKGITVSFANRVMHHDKDDVAGIRRMLEVEELSANWKKTFHKRLEGIGEDAGLRLYGNQS